MNTQLKNKLNLFKIINDSIDIESYTDQQFDTIAEKAKFVLECFESEYDHEYEKQRTPDKCKRVAGWLAGLPTVCTVPFYNNEILKIGYDLGMIKKEKQEDDFLENWFYLMAVKLVQMATMGSHSEKTFQSFLNKNK